MGTPTVSTAARVAEARPRFTEEEAAAIARSAYGMATRARELPSERDQNFLLRDTSGDAFVLKLSRHDDDPAVLGAQNAALAALDSASLPYRFPRLLETRDGTDAAEARDAAGRRFPVRLFDWVAGRPLADLRPRPPSVLHELGAMLGALDRVLAGVDHPGARRDLFWDLRHGRRIAAEGLDALDDEARRALVARALARYDAHGAPRAAALRTGLIHGDANDHNVLVRDSPAPARVAGLIDFGDMAESWYAGEAAIGAAYAAMGEFDPLAAAARVVAGYHGEFPLDEAELDAVFPLMLLRLAVSVTVAASRWRTEPDNAYLQMSDAHAWALLERLDAVSTTHAGAVFRHACGSGPAPPPALAVAPPPPVTRSADALLAARRRLLGPNLSVSYGQPLVIVRGWMQHLYDAEGRAYLDCVNNIAHVGHGHPRVVEAIARQAAVLNTNTRYLHETILELAERLAAMLPDPLRVCYFVNSGSEANELALRLARTYTGRRDVVVLEGAYHGNSSALVELSPYKFDGPGGAGAPAHVHVAPVPDPYRGRYRGPHTADRYASEVADAVAAAGRQGGVAAFFAESFPSCAGQIEPPPGFLAKAFGHVRAAGGVCVADEVQVGFGRVGSHFWGFETQDAVPDIVTVGKPMGNGHPVAAVVTTSAIAEAFDNGMEFFSSFGGNPVSCAAALAVLDVIRDEGLQEHAARVGARLADGLRALATRHPRLGDVRGRGLFLGAELVADPATREPDGDLAARVTERLREEGILLSTDGPDRNVFKIKPPLAFTESDADRLVEALDRALAREPMEGARP